MQGGRGRGDPFFGMGGDPFAGFGGMPSLFGGRDPFDDPFFTNPMAGMLQPNPFGHMGSSLLGGSPFGGSFMGGGPFGNARSPFMGGSPFGPSLLGPSGSPFMDAHEPRGYEHRQSMPNTSRGPVIEELNSDDENDGQEAGQDSHMHGRSARQPYVEQPYDGSGGRDMMQSEYGNQFNVMHDTHSRPQTQSFTFQSSTVAYGGSNGAYYTSSTTRRDGSDGLKFEEHKEADSVTGQAAHRVSRGIRDKGHTLSRHLKSDGQVDSMQTLHNINEDELTGFEEAWKGKASKHLPGWAGGNGAYNGYHVIPFPTIIGRNENLEPRRSDFQFLQLVLKDLVSKAGVFDWHCLQLRTDMQVKEDAKVQQSMLHHQKCRNVDELNTVVTLLG